MHATSAHSNCLAQDLELDWWIGKMQVDESAVQRLRDLTHCSPEQAQFLLEAVGGTDIDAAVQMFYEQLPEPRAPDRAAAPPDAALPPRPLPPAAQQQYARQNSPAPPAPQRRRHPGLIPALIGTAVSLPFLLVRTSFGLLTASFVLSFGIAAFVGDRVLPARVMRAIRGVYAALTGAEDIEPRVQAEQFIQKFKDAFGDRHPSWVSSELQQACVAARTAHKFLLVYLHAPEHQDTERFCREVLCDPDLVAYANQQFVCWGGNIHHSDAHALSIRLGATTFPFIAVLSMAHNNKAMLIKAAQGRTLLTPGTLLQLLQRAMDEQGALLVAQRAEQQERETTRQLLAEQNAEYEASLAADRAREAARAAEQEAAERAAREKEEEEARARAAQEAAERKKQQRIDAIASRREQARQKLQQQAAAVSNGDAGMCSLRVRLPDGSTAQQSFPAMCCVGSLFDFVDSLDSTNYWKYNLVSNYPRKVYTQDDSSTKMNLTEAGLVPHAALFVQPLDEEDEL